jgi:hypothetical protein
MVDVDRRLKRSATQLPRRRSLRRKQQFVERRIARLLCSESRFVAQDVMTRHGLMPETSGHGRRTGTYSPGQSAYASSPSLVSLAADAPYFAATSLTG